MSPLDRWRAYVARAITAAALGLCAATCLAAPRLTYESTILPLFKARCVSCHGGPLPSAGLVLSRRGDLLQGGHSGPAIVPGLPEESRLVRYLASGKMPRGGPCLSPSEVDRVRAWIRAGAPGEPGGGHWAFIPPVRPSVPMVSHPSFVRNPIDAFLLSGLERKGLAFSPQADRRTLIRRLTYDLIGLPPTPAEVDAFLSDRSPGAYEKLVDRLLADPRYGERWARHWLDEAGYADSEGILQEDLIRPNAWRYRDYVIRSLNEDKPYDCFLREQIAGDELVDYRRAERFTPAIIESLTATGFLRTAVDATRPDFNMHQFTEYQYRMLNDTETILATGVMGIPLQCARCHDHKYEPLSQRDYYRVQALFAGAIRPQGPLLPSKVRQIVAAGTVEQKEAKEQNASIDAAVKSIAAKQDFLIHEFRLRWLQDHVGDLPEADRQSLLQAASLDEMKRTPVQKALLANSKSVVEPPLDVLEKRYPDFQKRSAELLAERKSEEAKRKVLPEIRALYDQDANPPATHLLIRGEWARPGDAVVPGIPTVLINPACPFDLPAPAAGAPTTGRRKALADWLTRPDNPLTARVIVNRVWAHHFGVGIVPTVENLGRSGAAPTNQPLLDWLAATFVTEDGRRKTDDGRTTNDERRTTTDDGEPARNGGKPQSAIRNPSSVARHPSSVACSWSLKSLHRLIVTSTAYRQASVNRPEAARVDPDDRLLWRQRQRRLEAEAIRDGVLGAAGNLDPAMFGEPVATETRAGGDTVPAGEEKGGRRSIYLLVRRSQPVSLLNAFDEPIMETNCTRRTVSTTATQALALMNSSFITAEARQFARRILKEQPPRTGTQDPADAATITDAFRLAFLRTPTPSERNEAIVFVRAQADRYRTPARDSKAARECIEAAYADFCQALLGANEFFYVD